LRLSTFNQSRVRDVNSKEFNTKGEYVLYWMQAYRRLHYNHALDYAINLAEEVGKPLVVYEGIRMNYPWASPRLHQFILEGICDNSKEAEKLGITYWAFVETPQNKDKELLF
jgi:deoxyribodipyrimidine photo-lyase